VISVVVSELDSPERAHYRHIFVYPFFNSMPGRGSVSTVEERRQCITIFYDDLLWNALVVERASKQFDHVHTSHRFFIKKRAGKRIYNAVVVQKVHSLHPKSLLIEHFPSSVNLHTYKAALSAPPKYPRQPIILGINIISHNMCYKCIVLILTYYAHVLNS